MKKLIPILTLLLVTLLVSSAKAITVTVTCNPEVIPSPGGTTTITVSSSHAASGSITVITPVTHSSSVCSITVPAGGSVSKVYPTDFPGGSTTELGEYDVTVFLSGQKWSATFYVTFSVIPELPFGTLMAVLAPLVATAGFVTKKRLRLKL